MESIFNTLKKIGLPEGELKESIKDNNNILYEVVPMKIINGRVILPFDIPTSLRKIVRDQTAEVTNEAIPI